MDDKQETILKELKRRAEEMRFGNIIVDFKIHEGKITKGDVVEKKESLC